MVPNDAATVSATPRRVRIGGEEHALAPLSIADFGALQVWVDSRFGDPFDLVNAEIARHPERYNPARQQHLFRIALDLARAPKPLIGTPEADELLRTVDGIKEVLFTSIAKAEPGFTRADADRLYGRMTIGDVARIFLLTHLDLVMSDPKAGTDGTPSPTAHPDDRPSRPTGGASSTPPPPTSRGRRRRRSRG